MADDKTPARPPAGEIAGANIGERLAPYIGELGPDPRVGSGYAHASRDEANALRLYRDTLRDERAQAALDQRLDAAISRPWEVEPGGQRERRDRLAAEDLAAQLEAIGFDVACRQLLHGVWYGYAVAEAIWQPEGGRVRLADLRVRAPDRFRWSAAGDLLLRTEAVPQGTAVPPAKFVCLARPGEHGDVPHGPGLARWCFWPIWLKRNGLKFWSVALERFGAPTVKGIYPRGAAEAEKDALLEIVHGLATSLGVILPEGQDIEIVESARRAGGDFQAFVGYLDRAVTTTILGQSSTTDQGPWRGTAEVQKDVRDETVAADARLLDGALNATIARWLTHWNFPAAAVPRIHRDASPPEDLDARANREEIVARTTGLRPTREHVETVYGGEWEEGAATVPSGDRRRAFAEGARGDSIDRAVHDALAADGWEPLMDPVVRPVLAEARAALARGDDLKVFRDRLPALLADMDDEALVSLLHRLSFSAALSGEAGLVDDDD